MHIGIRIGGALLIGAVIVAGAFYLRSKGGAEAGPGIAAVAEGFGAKEYIRSGDADGDGISDWEDELRDMALRANPDAAEYDPEAGAPDTFTGSFARSFFESYVRGDATGVLTEENRSAFLDASIASLEKDARDIPLTKGDIVVGESGEAELRAYGNAIAEIVKRNMPVSQNEIDILDRAVRLDDASELAKLVPIRLAYEAILRETLATPVPEELVFAHIALVNGYLAVKNDVAGMELAFSDPLYAMIRVKRYEDDGRAITESLAAIYRFLHEKGIRYADDEPAAEGNRFLK